MPRVKVNDDISINYEVSGEGDRVIVLTHGMGEALGTWDPDVPDLSRKYRVLRWDCRGHGESDMPDVPYSAAMHARDLAGLLKALGIAKAHVGGESMGGAIAQRFLLDFPEMSASGFILCSSSQVSDKMFDAWEQRAKIAEEQGTQAVLDAEASFGNSSPSIKPYPPEREELQRQWTLKIPGKIYAHTVRAMAAYNWTADLRTIRVPVLILQGLQDAMTPPGGSVIMHRNIPNSQLVMMDECSHSIMNDQPEQWRRHLLNFLDGVVAWTAYA